MENHPTNLGLIIIIMIACEPVYLGVYRDPFQLITMQRYNAIMRLKNVFSIAFSIAFKTPPKAFVYREEKFFKKNMRLSSERSIA